jgi:uncharacterized protein
MVMKYLRVAAMVLVTVGALNLGSEGIFGYNFLAHFLGGAKSSLTHIVYGLIGLSGIYSAFHLFCCMGCGCKSGSGCSCTRKR